MLQIHDHGRVRVLTLDRPEALNAFDTPTYLACAAALSEAADRHETACVVLTGTGRAFSAGQDLGEMSAIDTSDTETEHGFPRFVDVVSEFPKPLIAAVNGLGVGIGMTVLLHCDLALIARGARLKAPFTSLGVVPEAAGSALMPLVMGNQAAAYALYTADWITAEEAVAWGLALRVVELEHLADETLALAQRIARLPTASLVATKRLVVAARIDLVRAARAREDAAFGRMVLAPANLEALTAFLEKREPDFTRLPPQD